ncbi:MAG: A/G-specific adenine glycosylase [Oscillospiraceae bacterium]|jgi:A/G-specific adenine glycosylase|nr:A/G-specific adenine glycosylase [Oscillospiraceae bacterium]MCI1990322.1 A/G-specific adenine glycosylase [Oscillospiraceae bacterium]MCI2034601.1 A/G-specific adenine glycosylase [Oscillospiraceae bacterium]
MDYSKIVSPLLKWYKRNARSLPWRDDPTPYRVWISEIMLQQTRVEAVKPYFERFLREIPDVRALAEIPEGRLLKLWEGLGYYSRARSLKKAAGVLLEQYGGRLPASAEELKKLPGIGEYTAGAIASIAYGLPEPAVDGNVLRVAARLAASHRDVSAPGVKRELRESLRAVYPAGNAGAFTQSLMELGATVCLPNGAPLCGACPLAGLCEARRKGEEAALPVKAPKAERRKEDRTVFLILCGGAVAVRRRPETGLLAGLWEFPGVGGALSPERAENVLRGWGLSVGTMEPLPKAKHVFSHIEWRMTGYFVRVPKTAAGFAWAEIPALFRDYAVPSAFRAHLKFLRDHGSP